MSAWIQVTGWTLVHFVWQGAAIAGVTAGGLRLLRTAAPNARYAVASAGLCAMLVSPIITAHLLSANTPTLVASGIASPRLPSAVASPSAPDLHRATSDSRRGRVPAGPVKSDTVLTMLVAAWLAGVALLLLRLAGGWWKVRGLHRAALATTASHWQTAAARLTGVLHVRRVVHIVESVVVDTPTVVGWWRPVVLLPVAALASLTPDQVELILAHELAHIRRHDYLVNLLQHVTETLLFYHPAVWWLSARMRNEREQCCDEIVLQVCRDPVGYASALTQLETWRHERAPFAVAATHGSLIERIRLVLSVRPHHQRPLAHAVVTATVVGSLIAMVGGGYRWPLALDAAGRQAQRSTDPSISPSSPVVTLNGELITDRDLEQYRAFHPEKVDTPLSRMLVDLVNERLVMQKGKQLGYSLTDAQYQETLKQVMRLNHIQTDAQLQAALATPHHLTMADLRQNIERGMTISRVRQTEMSDRAAVTDDEAHLYFEAHLDQFPLQTFELAHDQIVKQTAAANLERDWDRYLQSLRMAATIVWARTDLERAYEEGLTRRGPQQDRAATPPVPPPQPAPTFEVASVKPNKSRNGERGGNLAGGRFTMTYATLRDLVVLAYQRQDGRLRLDSQIVGGPGWSTVDHFDVVAKAEGMPAGLDAANTAAGASTAGELSAIDRVRLMLRALLADRFKLTAHSEFRDLPIYALVMDRKDAKLGPQLKKVDVDCAALRDRVDRAPTSGAAVSPCGGFRAFGLGHSTGHAVTMSMIAALLEGAVGRNVFDRTGLGGKFDVDLLWTPDQPQGPGAPELLTGAVNGPSIFTAVREQLGLKLDSTTGPVDVLVIDHAEPPTEN